MIWLSSSPSMDGDDDDDDGDDNTTEDDIYMHNRKLTWIIVGGVSAAVSKTAAAPIERVKLLIQNQVCQSECFFFLSPSSPAPLFSASVGGAISISLMPSAEASGGDQPHPRYHQRTIHLPLANTPADSHGF
jgi:hypothetical protein